MHSFTPSDPSQRRLRHLINPHIDSRSRKSQNLYAAIGVVLVIVVLVAVWLYLKTDDTQELILNVVSLRKGPAEVVKKSALITKTNAIVRQIGNKRIQNDWDGLTECMPKGCTDVDYYNFIVTVITQKKVKHTDLIYNLILTNKYWGTNEIVDFSQSLTKVNEDVERLGSREVSKKWNEIIECDGKCQDKDDLFFLMIKTVVMVD